MKIVEERECYPLVVIDECTESSQVGDNTLPTSSPTPVTLLPTMRTVVPTNSRSPARRYACSVPASVLVAAVLLAVALVVAAFAVLSARRDLRDSLRWIEQLEPEADDDGPDGSEYTAAAGVH